MAQAAQQERVVRRGQRRAGVAEPVGDLARGSDDPGHVAGLAAVGACRRLEQLAIGEDGIGRHHQLLAQECQAGAVAQQRVAPGHRAACGCRHRAIWTPCGWGGPAAGICCASAMTERITAAARGPSLGAAIPAMAANP